MQNRFILHVLDTRPLSASASVEVASRIHLALGTGGVIQNIGDGTGMGGLGLGLGGGLGLGLEMSADFIVRRRLGIRRHWCA